jgi:hypothetical protein
MFSSSTNADWVPPTVMQYEAVELLTTGQRQSVGGMVLQGVCETLDQYPGSTGKKVMEQYNLFGDCSLIIRTAQPENLYVTHQPVFPIGSQTFDVYVYGVSGTLVSLTRDGVIYAVGMTDESGNVTLQLSEEIEEPGDFLLTVSGFNKLPYIVTVQAIAPDGPWLVLEDYTIDDTNSGNGNRKWDYGEKIDLYVTIANVGSDSAISPLSEILTEDTLITIMQDDTMYPDIESGGVGQNIVPLQLESSINTPNNHYVEIQNTIFANDSLVWESNLSIPVYAPEISLLEFDLNVVGGNGDAVFDPGETAQLTVSLINNGASMAENVIGEINIDDPYITILHSLHNYGILFADGGTVINSSYPYVIKSSFETPIGHKVEVNLNISEGNGYVTDLNFDFIIGFPEILIWDKDKNHNSGTVLCGILTDSIGAAVDYTEGFLPLDNLDYYKAIFIFLGVSPDNYKLAESDASPLVQSLNNGGCIYMEGGETWYYDTPTSLHSYFNINGTSDGSGDTEFIVGQSGAYAKGLEFGYEGDNSYMDRLSPVAPAISVFKNQNPSYINTVAYDAGTYKTIGSSFEFGGLVDWGDTNTKKFLASQMLKFFDIGLDESGLCDSWIKGDPDNNLLINVLDIVKVVNFILENSVPDTCQKWYSDLNVDNKIDVGDLVPLINIILNQNGRTIAKGNYDIATISKILVEEDELNLDSDGQIAAMQIELLSKSPNNIFLYPSNNLESMDYMSEATPEGMNIVIFSLKGNVLSPNSKLFRVKDDFEIGKIVTVNTLGDKITTEVINMLLIYSLSQNYPNPFNPVTVIPFSIPEPCEVVLTIYDIKGREVTNIVNEYMLPGKYSVKWNASDFASGVYIYRLKAGEQTLTKKLILLK